MNNFPSRETVERLRAEYPPGCFVKLIRMDDPQAPPAGCEGVVDHVDDCGTIFVRWQNGSSLGVVFGEDKCKKVL